MTSPLTLTLVSADAVPTLANADVLRSHLYEIEGAPEKRSYVLHRVQTDLFAVMRAGGLNEVADEFERDHRRLSDPDLFVRLMSSDDVAFVRGWLVREDDAALLAEPIVDPVIGEDGEPIDSDWVAAMVEELERLAGWFKSAWRNGDALLLITDG